MSFCCEPWVAVPLATVAAVGSSSSVATAIRFAVILQLPTRPTFDKVDGCCDKEQDEANDEKGKEGAEERVCIFIRNLKQAQLLLDLSHTCTSGL